MCRLCREIQIRAHVREQQKDEQASAMSFDVLRVRFLSVGGGGYHYVDFNHSNNEQSGCMFTSDETQTQYRMPCSKHPARQLCDYHGVDAMA